MKKALLIGTGVALVLGTAVPARAQLNFNLTDGTQLAALAGTDPTLYNQVRNGFTTAAGLWSSLFNDAVTVNIIINYAPLGSGILGQAGSAGILTSYTNVRNSLLADAVTSYDTQANATLPVSTPQFVINRTSNNGNSATPYLYIPDQIYMNRANAKAVGLVSPTSTSTDATITFSSNFNFDFDRSNGIASGFYDFVGIAAHEIGHAMGFVSEADSVDFSPNDTQTNYDPAALDLFRFSTDSWLGMGALRDISADSRAKFFSINGSTVFNDGVNANFSTGVNFGDGRQSSHWKDNQSIGIMDPTAAPGELLAISTRDQVGLDVIGWNSIALGVVPEPGTLALLGVGLSILTVRKKKTKRQL